MQRMGNDFRITIKDFKSNEEEYGAIIKKLEQEKEKLHRISEQASARYKAKKAKKAAAAGDGVQGNQTSGSMNVDVGQGSTSAVAV